MFNGSPGSVLVVVDVSGFTVAGVPSAMGTVASLTPARIADSRTGMQIPAAVPSFSTAQVKVTGHGGIPDSGVLDVLAHVTVVWPWASGYLTVWTVWPPGSENSRPDTSNLNFDASRQTVSNTAIALVVDAGLRIDPGSIQLFNGSFGSMQVIVDVTGYILIGT